MLFHFVGPIPVDLGTNGGELSPCLSSAHCSRQNWSTANLQSDLETIIAAVRETPRTIIVEERDGYIHAEASSALFGFVDDLELLAKQDTGMIQARSISRLGDSDLGVNAARLDRLKTLINETD
jgi:uncharacterized protein (DUF1499 family)